MTGERNFLGAGPKWPFQVAGSAAAEASGPLALSRYDELIRESILLILGTTPGDRLMRPDFGCGIHTLAFGTRDAGSKAQIDQAVRRSLIEWEPRIHVTDVTVEAPPGEARFDITVSYRVRATNTAFNLVYPFYLERGDS
jgi:uncharacterized protein